MGSSHRRLANVLWAWALIITTTDAAWNKGEKQAAKIEDAGFWDRILEDVASSIGSAEPSPAPLPAPTLPPVVATSSPTASPVTTTSPPVAVTPAPTRAPSTPPPVPTTSAPSAEPTESPSSDPTLSGCFVEATISCLDVNGIPCVDLVPPSGQCSVGTDVQIVNFAILQSTCEESRNSQDENFICEEATNLPEEGTVVVVSCQDSSGSEFFSETTSVGSSVTIEDAASGSLSDVLICTITEVDSADQLQKITINTSGDVDLFLNDKYGMLEVVSCEVEGQPFQTCTVPILYTYMLENTGLEILDVTFFQRTRDGVTVDLFDRIEGANPLLPGDSVSTAETEVIDICIDGQYETSVTVGADPLVESVCEDTATYLFQIENTCRVDIDVDCTSEDGTTCDSLAQLETVCPEGNFEYLAFRYESRACSEGDAACDDSNGGLTGDPVSISCTGSDGIVIGEPVLVENGETFAIAQSGGFSAQLTCTLSSPDGTILQTVSFTVSEAPLKAKFGGLTLEGCVDEAGVELVCETPISWTFWTTNIGANSLVLNVVEIVRGDAVIDLSDQITNPELAPGGSSEAVYQEVVDRCLSVDLTTLARAEAELSCVAEEVYELVFDAPLTNSPTAAPSAVPTIPLTSEPSAVPSQPPVDSTNAPTDDCDLLIEIGCIAPFDRADCNDIPPLNTECLESPSEMVMRYNGGDCGGGFNLQPETLYQCTDAQDSPPTEVGTASFIVVTGVETQEEYFAGFVEVGEEFTLQAGLEVAANTDVVIYDPSDLTDPEDIIASGNVLQTILFHTSCDDFLFLKDRFGAVQLTEFVNDRQGRVTCFQTVTLTFTMELPDGFDQGTTVGLTDLTVTSNIEISAGETQDLSQLVIGREVTSTTSVTVEEPFELDLTQRKRYTTSAAIVGESDIGKICTGNDGYQFTAGNALPPFIPTLAPTATPTITPFPTPDPETAACEIEASITCAYADGRRCDLQSPAGITCLGSTANFLQFTYDPDSLCTGDNGSTNFECQDSNLEVDRPSSVYLRMVGQDQDGDWYAGEVSEGQIIDVPTKRGDAMRIEISTVEEIGGPGLLLQQSQMNFDCTEESALTLMTNFGNLQLIGFENPETGLQQVFANIEITYTATNAGTLDMDLFGAFGSSPFSGFQDFLGGEVRPLSRDGDAAFVEEFTLNLDATAGSEFQFTLLAQGRGSTSEVVCDETDAFTLAIAA
jgi:hypothetical protein